MNRLEEIEDLLHSIFLIILYIGAIVVILGIIVKIAYESLLLLNQ